MDKIEECRARAKACEELAHAAADPKAKESYEILASSWMKLAEYKQVTKSRLERRDEWRREFGSNSATSESAPVNSRWRLPDEAPQR